MSEDVQRSRGCAADICLFYTGRRARSPFFFFFSFPFFNDRCCVSATLGTHYVTFPAVSAAAVEAATAGTGVITGNTVCDANQKNFAACCLSGPACLLVQVSLSVIGTQFFKGLHLR